MIDQFGKKLIIGLIDIYTYIVLLLIIMELELFNLLVDLCQAGCHIEIHNRNNIFPPDIETRSKSFFPKNLVYVRVEKMYEYNPHCTGIMIKSLDSYNRIRVYVGLDTISQSYWMVSRCNTIRMATSPLHHFYEQNQMSIHKLMIQIHSHKLGTQLMLRNFMISNCFGDKKLLYLRVCNKYLSSDIKRKIIDTLLVVNKWHNLGFYVL